MRGEPGPVPCAPQCHVGVYPACRHHRGVAAGVYLFHEETPYSLVNPIKWIGNVGAVILIFGSSLALVNRLSQGEDAGKGTYFDWLFLLVVLGTGVTGLLSEILRLADLPGAAYPTYFIHLVCVWFLFAYFPFSKFAHALYRTTALVYARHIGRELKKGLPCRSLSRPASRRTSAVSSYLEGGFDEF